MAKSKYGYCLGNASIQVPVGAKGDKQWQQAQRINKACDVPPQSAIQALMFLLHQDHRYGQAESVSKDDDDNLNRRDTPLPAA